MRTSPDMARAPSSSDVLPAPGALMRLSTDTSWRSKSSRFARAIVLLASSASSTILTFVLCMSRLLQFQVIDLELFPGGDGNQGRGTVGTTKRSDQRLPVAAAGLALEPDVDLRELEPCSLAHGVARHDVPVEEK